MHVIRFELSAANCVELPNERYFFFRDASGDSHMIPTTCPHRGGPLHLGCQVPERGTLLCPWHKGQVSVRKLVQGALPMIAVGGRVTVVLPKQEGRAPIVTRRKTLFDAVSPPTPDPLDREDHEKAHLHQ